jgi:hypothetical protein
MTGVKTSTRSAPDRSQRDELERLQEELQAARRQREALPREHAELSSQVEQLEQEVRGLRQKQAVAREEGEGPSPSLPALLVTPFRTGASRRTAYGRMRFALRAMARWILFCLFLPRVVDSPQRVAATVILTFLGLAMLFVLQGPDDDEDGPSWRFDEEGLSQLGPEPVGGKVRYREIHNVEVKRAWLQRLFGFGRVRVTWRPLGPTRLGKAVGDSTRCIDIDLLDDPNRLAAWLEAQVSQAREEKKEKPRVG